MNKPSANAAVCVHLPPPLLKLFPEAPAHVELEAANVREMIEALDERWPGMQDRLCDTRPAVRRHINIFIDGQRAALDTPIAPGTDVAILLAVFGG